MDTTKLKVSSVSEIMTNRAVFFSKGIKFQFIFAHQISKHPNIKGSKPCIQEINMLLAVLPAESLYFLYCLTAKCVGSFFSSASNSLSMRFIYVSSSCLTSEASIISSSVAKFFSSIGAS